jgi:SP family general alpha glucoside:H+ symporter-like MFS transporter
VLNANGKWEVTAPWQAGLSNGAAVGEIFGLFINGYISERYGYRKTVMVSLIWLTAFIALFVFAHNIVYLQVAEILCGE